jgi:ribosomal biogenesis protein LAS1
VYVLETPLTVHQMSIYLSSPSCPSFIHLLHSLLSADLLPIVGAAEIQSTRLSCAMAIVRFINGMVDPLQTGMCTRELYEIHADWTGPYARPISHIAASLKIPQSLISLRHRATHEDLPPLPLLKQAVHSAIEYINQYSFLPSLASTSSDPIPRSLRAENLVGRWKKLIKARSRGEIGGPESEREEKSLIREIDGEDMGEMAEALAAVGGLIPLAKR